MPSVGIFSLHWPLYNFLFSFTLVLSLLWVYMPIIPANPWVTSISTWHSPSPPSSDLFLEGRIVNSLFKEPWLQLLKYIQMSFDIEKTKWGASYSPVNRSILRDSKYFRTSLISITDHIFLSFMTTKPTATPRIPAWAAATLSFCSPPVLTTLCPVLSSVPGDRPFSPHRSLLFTFYFPSALISTWLLTWSYFWSALLFCPVLSSLQLHPFLQGSPSCPLYATAYVFPLLKITKVFMQFLLVFQG